MKKKRVSLKRRKSIDEIKNVLAKMNLFLVDEKIDKPITDGRFAVHDSDGYYYMVYWGSISKSIFPQKFHKTNPYTIQNINHYLELNKYNEYVCVSTEYYGNMKPLQFQHVKCGCIFEATLIQMQGQKQGKIIYRKQCPQCFLRHRESMHAIVLKNIFMHEEPDTIPEDKSCINPATGRILRTDIVNHRMRIAIEIQSSFHDDPDKKVLDKIKKDYWINRGYQFYDPDIRDYTIIELVNLFFPNISEIPDYISFNYVDTVNNNDIQELFNRGYTAPEVSSMLDITLDTIYGRIRTGAVIYPKVNKNKSSGIKSAVQLSLTGEFIKEYSPLSEIEKNGYALGTIQRVLRGNQKFAYGSYWVYSENYYSNSYCIPDIEKDKYDIKIKSINENGNMIFDTIYDAAKYYNIYPYNIYDIIIGKRKHIKGYTFERV